MGKSKKLVVTYAYNNWDINGCIGVYDDWEAMLGAVFNRVYEMSEDKECSDYYRPFEIHFQPVDGFGNYFDIEVLWPDKDKDLYRIYFIDEKEIN